MTFLPILFKTKIKSEKIQKKEILDLLEEYLKKERFRYISRKPDRITFHKANGWHSWDFRSFLVSGVIIVKEKNGKFEITNGNWMVFLIAIPFILFFMIGNSQYSTFEQSDLNMIYYAFLILFGLNFLTRFFAHFLLNKSIKKILKTK